MRTVLRWFKTLLLMACMVFLTYCTRMGSDSHLNQQKSLVPFTLPSSAYLAMANNQSGRERQALQLMAAGRAIYDDQWREGLAILQQAGPMSGELADVKNILLAKIDLIRNQPKLAIAKLARIKTPNTLVEFYQIQYHNMLAFAYQGTGSLVEAVIERIKLGYLLKDPVAKLNNQRALWLLLTRVSQAELNTLFAESRNNSELQGWSALAKISRITYNNPNLMIFALQRWQSRYPNHPAKTLFFRPLDNIRTQLFSSPKKMALILPLSGPLSGPGKAIEDGFMEAYRASGRMSLISVKVYDSNLAGADILYQKAVADGAEYIVGPLTKADVTKVAKLSHPVPTILLNETAWISDKMAFQFGLSPTHEARQIATKAHKSGYSKALIIAPAGDWGKEVVQAFTKQWTDLNGQVVETWQYTADADWSTGVRKLLHASESAARVRPTKPLEAVDNLAKRRHDFDVLILIAYPSIARQIMPLVRYYFASDVPIYATSSVYSGLENTAKDRDLNGVIFCDMPWVFTHQLGQQHQWPEQLNSYNRLYALGMDSFALSTQLNQLLLFPAIGMNDQSGVIYLTKTQKLSRILAFGQFRQGVARILEG